MVGELRERLILNHIITFYNVFGIEPATRLLFFKLEHSLHSYLKTFLIYLNFYNHNIKIYNIDTERLSLDNGIIHRLRELDKEED